VTVSDPDPEDGPTEVRPEPAAEPTREQYYRRPLRLVGSARDLWRSRELLLTLTEREIRARYKQAVLGYAWAALNPLLLMVVFTIFFDRVARVDTGGVPYPLFSYVALVPWTFFSQSVSLGGPILVSERDLISKVAFPRETLPLSAIGVAAFHATMSLPALFVLFALEGTAPELTSVWVPLLLAVQTLWTAGVVLIVSATLVYWRDLRQALPALLQLGLFATPVAYGLNAIPDWFLRPYTVLNPLVGIIDGYRRTVLYGEPPRGDLLLLAALGAVVTAVGGYALFKRLEGGFADVA
jgi:ABC-2 type transport system permease protein/lipopolysaccharide transport system permease protein